MGLRHLDLATAEEGCGDNALGRVRRAYETLPPDEFLEVLTTVPEQAFAVRVWTRRAGGGEVRGGPAPGPEQAFGGRGLKARGGGGLVEESREQGRIRIVLRRLDS